MIDTPNITSTPLINPAFWVSSLQGQLLVAMPNMRDERFARSLMLICHHDQDGALGLVLNQPTELSIQDLCVQMDIEHSNAALSQTPVYLGGPMDTHRGFFLHTDDGDHLDTWQNSLPISTGMGKTFYLTTTVELLQAIANNQGPRQFIFTLGYAGWSAGQLEKELANNVWLTMEADTNLLFNTSAEQRWQKSFQSLGFSLANFCTTPGYA